MKAVTETERNANARDRPDGGVVCATIEDPEPSGDSRMTRTSVSPGTSVISAESPALTRPWASKDETPLESSATIRRSSELELVNASPPLCVAVTVKSLPSFSKSKLKPADGNDCWSSFPRFNTNAPMTAAGMAVIATNRMTTTTGETARSPSPRTRR